MRPGGGRPLRAGRDGPELGRPRRTRRRRRVAGPVRRRRRAGGARAGARRGGRVTRLAVVGHVEWIEFVRVPYVPAPGEIVHASERWQTVGGGGAIVAVDLVRLGGEVTLFTALGDDRLGRRALDELVAHGGRVDSTFRPEPQRRCYA